MPRKVHTHCHYCVSLCGVEVEVVGGLLKRGQAGGVGVGAPCFAQSAHPLFLSEFHKTHTFVMLFRFYAVNAGVKDGDPLNLLRRHT